jgi:hypothetical protein
MLADLIAQHLQGWAAVPVSWLSPYAVPSDPASPPD